MPTIHILQRDVNAGVMDSYIIDIAAIAELHCRYPIQPDKEPEEDTETPTGEEGSEPVSEDAEADTSFDAPDPELEVMYTNGERFSFNVAVPTSFLLYLEGGEMVCKTGNMQEFEKAFLSASLQGYEADDSSE